MSKLLPLTIALILGVASLVANVHAASSFAQRAVLMTGADGAYPFISVGDKSIPDLGPWEFDKQARFSCVVGTWLLYEFPNYNTTDLEFTYGQQVCAPFVELGGRASSIRPVGSKLDWTVPTLTVYEDIYFTGEQELLEADTPQFTIPVNLSSLIVTGKSSDQWTLYSEPNFARPLACVYPAESQPEFTPGFLPDLSFFGWHLGSVSKGCNVAGLKSVELSSFGTNHGVLRKPPKM